MVMTFQNFLNNLPEAIQETVIRINQELTADGFQLNIKEAKSGPVVSYSKGKKVLMNYVCRKSGIKIRLYAAGILNYESILETVPKKTKVELLKARDCKKLNGQDCSPACPGGYIYQMDCNEYKKCRSTAFLMSVTPDACDFIYAIVKAEAKERG